MGIIAHFPLKSRIIYSKIDYRKGSILMKKNQMFLIGMSTALFVILAACGNSSAESSTTLEKQKENESIQHTDDDSFNSESTETDSKNDKTNTNTSDTKNNVTNKVDSNDTNENVDTPDNENKKEELPKNNTVSKKEEYVTKLNDTKKKTDEMRENPLDDSTYALKKVEGDRYDIWDGLLNEIYGVLGEQLPSEEMEQLREEQREWINYRDKTAKEASLKYEGGTEEHLEYVVVENNLTEERCFELVEKYMK